MVDAAGAGQPGALKQEVSSTEDDPILSEVVILTEEYYDWMLGAVASLPSTVKREGRLVYAASGSAR